MRRLRPGSSLVSEMLVGSLFLQNRESGLLVTPTSPDTPLLQAWCVPHAALILGTEET